MLLTRVAVAAVLIGAGAASIQAQSGPSLLPTPQNNRALNGFDISRYTLVLPKPVVPRIAAKPQVLLHTMRPIPCAAVRVTRPNPAVDSQMPVGDPKAVEPNSKDLGAMQVPAPSCRDFAPAK